jgi:glycosyltransferase involved in cell wall biosynthesis
MQGRPRVLLIAEAANPEWVSVPLVGWCHARAIAGRVDAHLVTQVRNREAIERTGLREGRDFTAMDSEAVARRVHRLGSWLRGGDGVGWTTVTALDAIAYWWFERLVWRRFGAALSRGDYDLVHRLTPLSPTTPSFLARRLRRLRVPFVLGPLNGGLPWPREFGGERRREREWLSYVRGLYRWVPGYRSTRAAASAILCGSQATRAQMPERYRGKCVYLPENGIDPARFGGAAAPYERPPLRVAFVGRLVPYKGADMLVEAAGPLVRSGQIALDVLGDGPERPRLQQLVRDLGIERGVELPGWIDHGRLQARLCESHVLGFPSIREFGGGVVLEAMALGLVPIVVDYGGPGELATHDSGIKVPLGPRAAIVAGVRGALERLVHEPERLQAMSARARERAHARFAWDTKAAQVVEVYRWVVGERDKPDFGCPLP